MAVHASLDNRVLSLVVVLLLLSLRVAVQEALSLMASSRVSSSSLESLPLSFSGSLIDVVVEGLSGIDALLGKLVSLFVLFCFPEHASNLFVREPALLVLDDDVVGLTGTLLDGLDEHLDGDCLLVVLVGGEHLGLLGGDVRSLGGLSYSLLHRRSRYQEREEWHR